MDEVEDVLPVAGLAEQVAGRGRGRRDRLDERAVDVVVDLRDVDRRDRSERPSAEPPSVSRNFTGTVEPSLKMLDPSALTGCWMPPNMYCTAVVQDARRRAADVVLRGPARRLRTDRARCRSSSSRTLPRPGPSARPPRRTCCSPWRSAATAAGHVVNPIVGSVASTWTPRLPVGRLVADLVLHRAAERVRAARGVVCAAETEPRRRRSRCCRRRAPGHPVGERRRHRVQVPAAVARVVRRAVGADGRCARASSCRP